MYLAVAVHTVFTQYILVRAATGQSLGTIGQAGMECGSMALLAQGRSSRRQQARLHGTVRPVAQAAILSDLWVLPYKRTALFLVTTQAVIVYIKVIKARITGTAVWVLGNG